MRVLILPCKGHYTTILGPWSDHMRVLILPCKGHYTTIVGSWSDHMRVLILPCKGHYTTIVGSWSDHIRGHYATIGAPLERQYLTFRNYTSNCCYPTISGSLYCNIGDIALWFFHISILKVLLGLRLGLVRLGLVRLGLRLGLGIRNCILSRSYSGRWQWWCLNEK